MNIENKIRTSIEQEKLENELSHKKYELENLNEEMAKENKQLQERIEYLERSIVRKEETITELEQEQVPYTNEYADKVDKENKKLNGAIQTYDILLKSNAEENKQLKDNWNKLKDYIVKEYYMYLPLEASTRSITILIDKMQELEKGSNSNVKD